jgi:autotransporter-associated beta strand protein
LPHCLNPLPSAALNQKLLPTEPLLVRFNLTNPQIFVDFERFSVLNVPDSRSFFNLITMNKCLLAIATTFAITVPQAFGDTTWVSTGSAAWSTSANWNNGVPGTTSGAVFQDGASIIHLLDLGATAQTSLGIVFNSVPGGSGFTLSSTLSPAGINLRAGGTAGGIINNDDSLQTFNVPLTMLTSSGLPGAAAAQTWNAASGSLLFSGIYSGSATTVNNNGGRLTVDGAFDTTIGSPTGRGDITGTGGLTKNGAGNLTLGGTVANGYTGGTIINAGTITAAKANAFGNGALTLSGSEITLNTSGKNQTFGVLNLAGSATIDLGAGASALTFANSSGSAWTGGLTILNWTQGSDSIRVGTASGGLTSAQLLAFNFPDVGGFVGAIQDANGFVIPVPEPSTVSLSLLGGFGLSFLIYRRRKN